MWDATIQALFQEETIKTMNQDAGIIVTEYGTVSEQNVGMMQSLFFGKTYKYSFSINVLKKSFSNTIVIVKTNLKVIKSSVWTNNSTHEFDEKNPRIESFMREQLFIRICKQLYPGQEQECNSIFSSNSQDQIKVPVKTTENLQDSVGGKSTSLIFQ